MKMKIYVVSIMAFSTLINSERPEIGSFVEHIPALIPAASIEDAAEAAKNFALDKWKQSEGWSGHQAAVIKVTKKFYDAAFEADEADIVDTYDETEEERMFQFTANIQDINSDDPIN